MTAAVAGEVWTALPTRIMLAAISNVLERHRGADSFEDMIVSWLAFLFDLPCKAEQTSASDGSIPEPMYAMHADRDPDSPQADLAPMRRRRRRLSEEEVRRRMFQTAKRAVRDYGITVRLEEVEFEGLIRAAEVPRNKVYALWAAADIGAKENFVNDFLMYLAAPNWAGTAGFDPETVVLATETILDRWEDLKTPEGLQSVVLETVQKALLHNVEALTASVEWEAYLALIATSRGSGRDISRHELNAELEKTELALIDAMEKFYETMLDAIGLRLRDDVLSYRQLAIAGASAVEGVALRGILATANDSNPLHQPATESLGEVLEQRVHIPLGGEATAEWHLAAWTFMAILSAATVPDPDWSPTPERKAAVQDIRDQAKSTIAQRDDDQPASEQ